MSILTSSALVQECSYNGFTFDPEYTLTTDVQIRPVPDKAGRTIIYNEYTISLRTKIFDVTGTTDAKVEQARVRLTKTGYRFVYRGRGMGGLEINVGSRKDVLWGPVPKVVGLKFFGGDRCVQLDWQVSIHIPDCPAAKFQFAPMEFSYRVEFHLRRNGRQNRVIAGELRIPNNRKSPGSRQLNDTPDAYRESIASPLARNFRREWGPWVIDESRTRLSFGWTDFEFDQSAFPEGIVYATASQRTHSSDVGLLQYVTTLRADYELAPGYSFLAAEKAFFQLVKDRFLGEDKVPPPKPPGNGGGNFIFPIPKPNANGVQANDSRPTFVPLHYEIDEPDLYGPPKAGFSLTFRIVSSSISTIIQNSGMFRPVPEADWTKWAASLKDSALHPRGWAQLRWTTGEDRIVDLCEVQTLGLPQSPSQGRHKLIELVGQPDPRMSWIIYEQQIVIEADSGVAEMRTLPEKELKPTKSGDFTAELVAGNHPFPGFGNPPRKAGHAQILELLRQLQEAELAGGFGNVGGSTPKPNSKKPDEGPTVQRRVNPSCTVYLVGRAMRVAYPIPCPRLEEIDDGGGEKIIPVLANRKDKGEGFVMGAIWNAIQPIYGAKWRLRYVLPKTPKGPIPPPPNPMLGSR